MKYLNIKSLAKQKGAALIVLVLAFIMATSVLIISNFSIDKGKIAYEKRTTEALATAKEALISYAITFHDTNTSGGATRAGMMGFLPCPEDAGSLAEGRSISPCGNQYDSYLGRLPWKSLGIEPIKDGSGNCLWYAVSSEYKNNLGLDRNDLTMASGLSRAEMLNEDSNGSFVLYDEALNIIKGQTPEERVIAVIIAPGGPVTGQMRTFDNSSQCGDDFNANQFLELFNTKDNSVISTGPGHLIDEFIASSKGLDDTFNDRIITISQSDIWSEIRRRVNYDDLMRNTTQALASCVALFGLNNPPAAPSCVLRDCQKACQNESRQCKTDCKTVWQACRKAASSKAERNICDAQKVICEGICDTSEASCLNDCSTNCGGGGNDNRLPWPAALDLSAVGEGYRDSQVYIEDNVSGNHLGRFPVDVNSTDIATGNSGGQYLIENAYCSGLNTDNGTVNLNTDAAGNSIERRIWQNWKDHFFYAVAGDYDASNASTPVVGSCTSCLQSNSTGTFAAIVMFSGQRQGAQVRNMQPDGNTKDIIGSYLEGSNNDITLDPAGNGDYQIGTVNDVAYCINENMAVSICP